MIRSADGSHSNPTRGAFVNHAACRRSRTTQRAGRTPAGFPDHLPRRYQSRRARRSGWPGASGARLPGDADTSMSEPRIGRVLVASLHQAIAEILPMRLEFYENWLNVSGLREGTIGLAPLSAVLSFLRSEGAAYSTITAR